MVAGGSIELREPPCASTLPSNDAICMESLRANVPTKIYKNCENEEFHRVLRVMEATKVC